MDTRSMGKGARSLCVLPMARTCRYVFCIREFSLTPRNSAASTDGRWTSGDSGLVCATRTDYNGLPRGVQAGIDVITNADTGVLVTWGLNWTGDSYIPPATHFGMAVTTGTFSGNSLDVTQGTSTVTFNGVTATAIAMFLGEAIQPVCVEKGCEALESVFVSIQ